MELYEQIGDLDDLLEYHKNRRDTRISEGLHGRILPNVIFGFVGFQNGKIQVINPCTGSIFSETTSRVDYPITTISTSCKLQKDTDKTPFVSVFSKNSTKILLYKLYATVQDCLVPVSEIELNVPPLLLEFINFNILGIISVDNQTFSNSIVFYDSETNQPDDHDPRIDHESEITCITSAPILNITLTASRDGAITVWDSAGTAKYLKKIETGSRIRSLVIVSTTGDILYKTEACVNTGIRSIIHKIPFLNYVPTSHSFILRKPTIESRNPVFEDNATSSSADLGESKKTLYWTSSAKLQADEQKIINTSEVLNRSKKGDNEKLEKIRARERELQELSKKSPEERDEKLIRSMPPFKRLKYRETLMNRAFDNYMDQVIWKNSKMDLRLFEDIYEREKNREKTGTTSKTTMEIYESIENNFFDKLTKNDNHSAGRFLPNSVLVKILKIDETQLLKAAGDQIPDYMLYDPDITGLDPGVLNPFSEFDESSLEDQRKKEPARKKVLPKNALDKIPNKKQHDQRVKEQEEKDDREKEKREKLEAKKKARKAKPSMMEKMEAMQKEMDEARVKKEAEMKDKSEKEEAERAKREQEAKDKEEQALMNIKKVERSPKQAVQKVPIELPTRVVKQKPVEEKVEKIEEKTKPVESKFPEFLKNYLEDAWFKKLEPKFPVNIKTFSPTEFVEFTAKICEPLAYTALADIDYDALLQEYKRQAQRQELIAQPGFLSLVKSLAHSNDFVAVALACCAMQAKNTPVVFSVLNIRDPHSIMQNHVFKKWREGMMSGGIFETARSFLEDWKAKFVKHIQEAKNQALGEGGLAVNALSSVKRDKPVIMELDLDRTHHKIDDADVVTYIIEMLFEEQLRKANEEKQKSRKPNQDSVVYPSDSTIESQAPNTSLVRLGRMNTESRPDQRSTNLIGNMNNQVDNAIVQQHKKLQAVIIEDPLKWTASKLNYPMKRVGVQNGGLEGLNGLNELNLLSESKTEQFHYQPIILTIRSTRQRYFLPETSYVMQQTQ